MYYIKIALTNFKNNKLRFWLNISSVIAGVILLALILTLSSSFKSVLYDQMRVSDERVLTVAVGNKANSLNYTFLPIFDDNSLDIVSSNEHIVQCATLHGFFATSIYSNNPDTGRKNNFLVTTVYGADESLLGLYETSIGEGRYPANDNEILIGAGIAETYDVSVSDVIYIEHGPETYLYKVSGITNKQAEQAYSSTPTMMNNILLVRSDSRLFANQSDYISIIALVDYVDNIKTISDELSSKLNENLDISEYTNATGIEITIISRLDVLEMIDGWFVLVNLFIAILFGIVSIIVILNLSNMMIMTILQRTKEIGVLKVIGGSNSQVSRFYLAECLIIGVLGTIIGILISILLLLIICNILGWAFIINIQYILYEIILGIGSPLIAGLLTQRRISALQPATALNEAN
jgi:putative ABC transport system permease protein